MRKIVFAVLLSCCLIVPFVAETRVCADAEMWFGWYEPNIHGPMIDNDGDGYYDSANLCIGVQSAVEYAYFVVRVYGRDDLGFEYLIYSTLGSRTRWSDSDQSYEYLGHTQLVVPWIGVWDFRLELSDLGGVKVYDSRSYGSLPTLTDVKMECGNLALVVRGEDNRIYYRIYYSSIYPRVGVWGYWNVVPTGATIDSPAASFSGDGTLQIVVKGMDGQSLWHCAINLTDNSFSGWDRVNGATNSRPTLHSIYTDLDTRETILFVRGLDNRVYYSPYDTSHKTFGYTWNVVSSGSTCDSPAASYFCTVVRGMDGNSLWYANRTFTGWQQLDGATNSPPTLTDAALPDLITKSPPSVYLPHYSFLVVRGLDNVIYTRMYSPSSGWHDWYGPACESGATCDSPAVAAIEHAGREGGGEGYWLYYVVRGMDGHSLWWYGYGINSWELLSGSTPSAPTLTS